MNIVDGSGLSPMNSVTARGMTDLLIHMIHSSNFEYYLNSLPEAGKEGTLKNYFHDVAFNSVMRAKSGSMTRVRSYAGYITARSGRKMAFCMIANDFSGPSRHIVSIFEGILKDIILNN
jgi:D-alanyl-D-alanine carboxypeptidase/D-alanyl-D-alanine-endopeptidase (penicillin-binding protein 4)